MARQYSVYPNQYDENNQLPTAIDNITPINAEVINRLKDAIQAIEAELGIKPSGTYATVRARLDDITGGGGGGGSGTASSIAVNVATFTNSGPSTISQTSIDNFQPGAVVEKVRLYTSSGLASSSSGTAIISVGDSTDPYKFFTIPNFANSSPAILNSSGDIVDVYINQSLPDGDSLTVNWINNGANITGDLTAYAFYTVPKL